MAGPFLPVWALSRSQQVRIGNHNSAPGNHLVPQLTQNPSTAGLPAPYLVDLSDGTSRKDLGHHIAIGAVIPAHGLRLTSSLGANSAAIASTPTLVNKLAIPANALTVGSSIRVTVQGTTSATGNITAALKVGSAGTTSDATLVTQTAAGVTSGGLFTYDALVTCQAVGSGTTGKLMPGSQLTAHATAAALAGGTQASVDTTIAEFIDVVFSVSAGTVTINNSLIEFLDSAF